MGNELTVEKIIQNLHQFELDLGVYELIEKNGFQQNRMINKWQHKFTSQRLIEKKYLVRTWLQFYDLLESFSFRYNSNYVIASKYLIVQNSQSIKKLSNQKAFPDTSVSIFFQDTLTNLSHFKQIPQQDGAYFLVQSLKGFGSLVKKIKFSFAIKQQMFHITANKQLKIWVDENITDINLLNKLKALPSQSYMIHKILETIKRNVFFTTQSQKVIYGQNCYMPPIIIDELIKRKHQNFEQAIQMTYKYLNHYQVKVGSFMSCLKDLTNQELISFMDQNNINAKVPHYASSTTQNSRLFINNNSSQISTKPFTPINQFSNQSSVMQLQRNYSMGNLTNYQHNNQSRVIDYKIHSTAKNSRSKSNKKSGLSLVKKHQKNYQSSIVIKQQRPISSFVNNNSHSPLKIQPQSSKLPPRSSSAKKVQFTISQQKQNVTPFNQNNSKKLQLSNHHSRGILITKKQSSQQKQPNIQLNPQSPFSRANNHFNTQFSSTINCSTVSIGPLPTPKYRNDSKAKTTFNPNKMSINFSAISPTQKFAPNQSLTRFQKENISYHNPGSLNTSVAQNYQMPRIYVHSPKAQGKILRLDSMSTEQESAQKPLLYYQPSVISNVQLLTKKQEDHIKEYQLPYSKVSCNPKNTSKQNIKFQTPSNRNKKGNQFDSYIDENNEVFTHPRLYQYITNNKSDNTVKQQKKSPFKRTQQKKSSYIDYLANVQISQSLDYHTADKIFSLGSNKQLKDPVKKPEIVSPLNNFSLNDFPTIEQIQEPPHSYDGNQKQDNGSFLPVQLNLKSNTNLGSKNQLSTVRRGQQQSLVVQYKKFYDDTNRSNNSPNKHFFSPLKKKPTIQLINPSNFQSNMAKKYSTAQNWQASPPKPVRPQATLNNYLFPIQQHPRPLMIIASKPTEKLRQNSPSPVSKIIYNGTKQPAINPLLLQDMQRIRQNQIC